MLVRKCDRCGKQIERMMYVYYNGGRMDFCNKCYEEYKAFMEQRNPNVDAIKQKIIDAGGCDARDEYSRGWDDAIAEAISKFEER